MMQRHPTRLIPAIAAAIALAAIAAGNAFAEQATVVRSGNLVLRMNGGVFPKKLPRTHLAPIALRASGSLATQDGSHPPAARTVTVDFDKHGTINARGLAKCRPGKLQSRDTKRALAACRPALVGRGTTSVEVAFPEQQPFSASGPLTIFNGGVRHGVTTMYIHAFVPVPTPTAIVTVVKIRKIHKGPYGTRAVARIPKIAGGSGSLTRFAFSIHRTFRRGGKKQSYLLARCANGRFRAHATIQASDGSRISGSILRRCAATG
jgi:hypothetical protein